MFFDNDKHQVTLHPPSQVKLDSQNKKRLKVFLKILLTPELIEHDGCPLEISKAFDTVAPVSNGINRSNITTEYGSVNIALRPLPDKSVSCKLDNVVFQKVYVHRKVPKEGAATDVFLHMSAIVPYSRKVNDYFSDNAGADVFAEFEQGQMTMQDEDAPEPPKQRRLGDDQFAEERAAAVDSTPVKSSRKKSGGKAAAAGDTSVQ